MNMYAIERVLATITNSACLFQQKQIYPSINCVTGGDKRITLIEESGQGCHMFALPLVEFQFVLNNQPGVP